MEQGLLQVYTGSGKGKTTAASGLILRALGQGYRVLLVRFLKPDTPQSSEVAIFEKMSGIDVVTSGLGGIAQRSQPQVLAENVAATFAQVRPMIVSGYYDLVVLDEFNAVLGKGYLPLRDGLDLLSDRPAGTELVLTGRHAPAEVLQQADLVTEMVAVKHPFEKGIPARPGIEF